MENNTAAHKLGYCQSIRAARAAVKALIAAGYKASTGKSGYIYADSDSPEAVDIMHAAIKTAR